MSNSEGESRKNLDFIQMLVITVTLAGLFIVLLPLTASDKQVAAILVFMFMITSVALYTSVIFDLIPSSKLGIVVYAVIGFFMASSFAGILGMLGNYGFYGTSYGGLWTPVGAIAGFTGVLTIIVFLVN